MGDFAEEQVEDPESQPFEPLPALLEDEENVSLADVLSLWDSCLTEQDIWAICLECSQSLKSIAHSAIFQTLCITPDTLAFNTNGNVCFMEQISDDPEGDFVPPEFDITGNTFEAHIFSLGATLQAAVEYTKGPEILSEFSQNLHTLLEEMQEENPKERPDIKTVILLCKDELKLSSSSDICQRLSATGRRVLSIESCGNFQDSCDNLWNGQMDETVSPCGHYKGENNGIKGNSSLEMEDWKADGSKNSSGMHTINDKKYDIKEINLLNERFCCQHDAIQLTECKEENHNMKNSNTCMLDAKPYANELERGVLKKNCLRKIETFPKLPSESDTDPLTVFPLIMHNGSLPMKHQLNPESLSLISNNEHFPSASNSINCDDNQLGLEAEYFQKPNVNLEGCLRSKRSPIYQHCTPTCDDKQSYFFQYSPEASDNSSILNSAEDLNSAPRVLDNYKAWKCCGETSPTSDKSCLLQINQMTTVFTPPNENGYRSALLNPGEKNLSEMKDYYIEDKQVGGRESEMKTNEQWVFLKLLLTQYGKPLKDYELWALCHECLLALQTCADYPAYLCLDSVLINSDGRIHFTSPQSEGSYDMLYLAPELAEVDFITEKVCIYCIAAILWRAAKYNFPPDHKLVLPRKLKNFLLDMARRKSEDRPSLADAIKTCDSYLHEQNIDSKKVLAVLIKSAFQVLKEELDSFHENFPFEFPSGSNSVDDNLGFLPTRNKIKLIAVKGPVPYQPSLNGENTVWPTAFTSPATHFKPIILHQNTDVKKDTIVTVSEKCVAAMERTVPMDNKNAMLLNVDAEDQNDEDSVLPTVCVSPDILEHDEQGSKTSLHTTAKEQHPNETSSSMEKLPLISDALCNSQEKSTSVPASPNVSQCTLSPTMPLLNNFLLKQDPETRVLTLVPVQIAVSEQIPNKPLHSRTAYSCCPSLQVLLSDAVVSYRADKTLQNTGQDECGESKVNMNTVSSAMMTNKETQTTSSETNLPLTFCSRADNNASVTDHTFHASVDQSPACSFNLKTSHKNDAVNDVFLKKAVHLIQEEFAFGSYLENTDEALAIGRYIFSLKDLKYNTFCNAISEKFCDLYWEEQLLSSLYDAANGRTIPSVRTNDTEFFRKDFQSMNKPNNLPNSSDETNATFAGMNVDDLPQNHIEKEDGSRLVIVGTETEKKGLQTDKCYHSPDLPKRNLNQEADPEMTEGKIYAKWICPAEFQGVCPGWSTAFYGSECFGLEVHNYVRKLGKQQTWQVNGIQSTGAKRVELEQLIMIETKNYRKSIKFYRRLLHKERRNKGCETKTMLPKLRGQLEEMKSKIQFLGLVEKYLQIILIEKWGVEPCNLPTVVNMARSELLDIDSLDCVLLFYNINKTHYKSQYNDNQNQPRNLQAGTPLGFMTYLYSRNAFLEGYVQQFLFTFRYFCTQEELLQFLLDRIGITLPSSNLESCSLLSKIYHRSFSILQTWIEDCYAVDFTINPDLMSTLKDFIISKVAPLNGYGKRLLSLLEGIASRKQSNAFQCCNLEEWKEEEEWDGETKSLRTLCTKISRDATPKSLNLKFSKGNEAATPYRIVKQYSIAASLPKPCYTHLQEEFSSFYTKIDGGLYFLTEYSAQQLCCQLTLLEQEMFHKCHPVHFLNSRLLGVNDKSAPLQKATSSELLPTQLCNLFVQNCVQDDYLLQLLKYADNVSTWVAAEIVTSYSSKVQVNLLSKFLFIAKCCYEHRNFATTVQILRGLENLIVRQLPVWKCLPARVSEIMEELKAVEVFLKSDSLCLMEGERFKTLPTIPSAHILAMHVQQLETGGFTMRNGTYKWTKLRNIAKVVSQVQAFQENPYMFTSDHQLQSCLRHRIQYFNDADISALAADNYANFHQIPAEKQSRKIQDTLHRMKAMFQ